MGCVGQSTLEKHKAHNILVSSCFYIKNQVGPWHMINFLVTQSILPSQAHVSLQLFWLSFWHNFGVCLFCPQNLVISWLSNLNKSLRFHFSKNPLLATLVKYLISLSWIFWLILVLNLSVMTSGEHIYSHMVDTLSF